VPNRRARPGPVPTGDSSPSVVAATQTATPVGAAMTGADVGSRYR
jgi:hypothetical protein